MERHKCKLCSRKFSNGRALGGHMKAHLATLPLPPKPPNSPSFSYHSSSQDDDDEEHHLKHEYDEKSLTYGLRENPKKCFRLADPEFDSGSVVQDRESETESKINPTRRRSKRTRRPVKSDDPRTLKFGFLESPETEPASSVSNTSPEEDVAMCLMMLSRDTWSNNNVNIIGNGNVNVNVIGVKDEDVEERSREIKLRKVVRGKHKCDSCEKTFRSSRALGSHRSVCERWGNDSKIFECPFCGKVFGSGQALGGHKRSHLMSSLSSTANDSVKLKESFIDLNLPAPAEEDDLSVVSDA